MASNPQAVDQEDRKKIGMISRSLIILVLLLPVVSLGKERPPNIVLFMAEDIGNDLACYGHPGVKTPTLDNLAANGIRYERFYTNSPICSPSRTSLMLGVHQGYSGGHHHRSNVKGAPELHYLTHYLREVGYTCMVGTKLIPFKTSKIDVNVQLNELMFDKKAKRSKDTPFFWQIQLQVTHRQANSDRWVTARQKSPKPVMTSMVKIPPYLPDIPEVRLDWATYLDQMELADQHTKIVIEDMRKRGELENTVIIWMGDNGRCQIRGKGYLYEDGIRCPLIISGKGIEKGKVVNDLTSGVDLSATILALAGIEKPKHMHGQLLLNNPNYQPKEFVYSARDRWDEIMDCSRTVVGPRFKYIRNFMPEVPFDAGQKYLDIIEVRPILPLLREMNKSGKLSPEQAAFFNLQKEVEQLFDLQNDPFELKNLANSPEHQSIKAELKAKLFQKAEEIQDKGLVKVDGVWKAKYLENSKHN